MNQQTKKIVQKYRIPLISVLLCIFIGYLPLPAFDYETTSFKIKSLSCSFLRGCEAKEAEIITSAGIIQIKNPMLVWGGFFNLLNGRFDEVHAEQILLVDTKVSSSEEQMANICIPKQAIKLPPVKLIKFPHIQWKSYNFAIQGYSNESGIYLNDSQIASETTTYNIQNIFWNGKDQLQVHFSDCKEKSSAFCGSIRLEENTLQFSEFQGNLLLPEFKADFKGEDSTLTGNFKIKTSDTLIVCPQFMLNLENNSKEASSLSFSKLLVSQTKKESVYPSQKWTGIVTSPPYLDIPISSIRVEELELPMNIVVRNLDAVRINNVKRCLSSGILSYSGEKINLAGSCWSNHDTELSLESILEEDAVPYCTEGKEICVQPEIHSGFSLAKPKLLGKLHISSPKQNINTIPLNFEACINKKGVLTVKAESHRLSTEDLKFRNLDLWMESSKPGHYQFLMETDSFVSKLLEVKSFKGKLTMESLKLQDMRLQSHRLSLPQYNLYADMMDLEGMEEQGFRINGNLSNLSLGKSKLTTVDIQYEPEVDICQIKTQGGVIFPTAIAEELKKLQGDKNGNQNIPMLHLKTGSPLLIKDKELELELRTDFDLQYMADPHSLTGKLLIQSLKWKVGGYNLSLSSPGRIILHHGEYSAASIGSLPVVSTTQDITDALSQMWNRDRGNQLALYPNQTEVHLIFVIGEHREQGTVELSGLWPDIKIKSSASAENLSILLTALQSQWSHSSMSSEVSVGTLISSVLSLGIQQYLNSSLENPLVRFEAQLDEEMKKQFGVSKDLGHKALFRMYKKEDGTSVETGQELRYKVDHQIDSTLIKKESGTGQEEIEVGIQRKFNF